MALDVAVKSIPANNVEGGDTIFLDSGSISTQRYDRTSDLPEPPDDIALSGMYYQRFDNKGYY